MCEGGLKIVYDKIKGKQNKNRRERQQLIAPHPYSSPSPTFVVCACQHDKRSYLNIT